MKKRKKIFVKLIRNIEAIKTVAIILLMVSCVYFGLLIYQYQAMPNSRNLSFFVWDNFEYMEDSPKDDNLSTDKREIIGGISAPVYIVSDNAESREIFYSEDEEYTQLCDIIDNYIFSIYTGESKATAEKIADESNWTEDLNSKFIYAKLPIDISTMLISGTEYEGNMISKSIESYDEIIMTANSSDEKYGNSTVIYLSSSKSNERLRIILDRSPLTMLDAIDSKIYGAEKACIFAFELQNNRFSDYEVVNKINGLKAESKLHMSPMFIIPLSTIDTHAISLSVPEGYSEEIYAADSSGLVDNILDVFGYDKNGARQYRDNDGNIVFVDGSKTLEFSEDGVVSYTNLNAHKDDKKILINGILDLYTQIYKTLSAIYNNENGFEGDMILASVNSRIEKNEERNVITDIAIDYQIGGSMVKIEPGNGEDEDYHFITARLCNGNLQSLSICVRDITLSDELSPNESAFTALERYIENKSQSGSEIRISDMRLEYIFSPSSSKCHTKWVVSEP